MPYQGETALLISLLSVTIVLILWFVGLKFEKEQLSKNRDDHH